MGITHVIRGDDHLTNAFRQTQIYRAMGWAVPHLWPYAADPRAGRRQAVEAPWRAGVEAYRDMGYLPETMRNYLLRLGWSHGDDEIISTEQAIAWFTGSCESKITYIDGDKACCCIAAIRSSNWPSTATFWRSAICC
jgi:glutamyl-tRNA synthetase